MLSARELEHMRTLEERLDKGGWKGSVKGKLDGVMVLGPLKPFRTYVVPKNYPGFKHDTDGRCVVESRQQMNDYRKTHGLEWE